MVGWIAAAIVLGIGLESPTVQVRNWRDYGGADMAFAFANGLALAELVIVAGCLFAMLAGHRRRYVPRAGAMLGAICAALGLPALLFFARVASTSDGDIVARYGAWVMVVGFVGCAASATWLWRIAAARERRSKAELDAANRQQLIDEGGIVPDSL
jgi:hypothetical protein